RHRARARKVRLVAEISARVIVGGVAAAERRRTEPAWIGPRLPGVTLMAALVVPGGEVGMVVLAADLEQMWMVRDQLGDDACRAEIAGQRPFPDFDRAPRLPQEVQRAAQDIVPRRYAWQRARVVPIKANGAAGKCVEVRGRELAPAVGAQHVPIEAVEQDYDRIARPRGGRRVRAH